MGLPKQVSGSTYADAWEKLARAASTANGDIVTDEPLPEPLVGASVPQLSNGEAAAVMQGWRRAAQRSSVPWSLWYELTIYALGWRVEGDRFDMTKQHATEPYPPDMLPLVWAWTERLAADLDAHRTVVRPIYIDTSWNAYEQTARLAWEQMEEDRRKAAGDAVEAAAPDVGAAAARSPKKSSSGGGIAWLLIALAFAAGRKGRR